MWGKGRRSASTPPCPLGTSLPSVSTTTASTPGSGRAPPPGRQGMHSGGPSASPPRPPRRSPQLGLPPVGGNESPLAVLHEMLEGPPAGLGIERLAGHGDEAE